MCTIITVVVLLMASRNMERKKAALIILHEMAQLHLKLVLNRTEVHVLKPIHCQGKTAI